MRAIVHIGQPKTGTSTIQSFLQLNVDRLAEQGVRYSRNVPERGSQFEYAFAALHRVGDLPIDKVERAYYGVESLEALARMANEATASLRGVPSRFGEDVAVFSSEHFAPWMQSVEAVKHVDAMFREVFDDVRYIVYFRNPLTLSLSRYSETLKRGRVHTLAQFLKKQQRFPSLYDVAARWRDGVGGDRISARLLEKDWLHKEDLLEDFCKAIGVDIAGMEFPERVNEGLNQLGVACMRALNETIPPVLPDGRTNARRKHLIALVEEFSAGAPPLRATPQQLDSIEELTHTSNERLRAEFFPDRASLFARPSGDIAQLTADELAERKQELLIRIIARQHEEFIAAEDARNHAEAAAREPVGSEA